MLIYPVLICILLVASVPGKMQNKQQVCMDVEDACSIPDLGTGRNTAQGPPGKRGPIGLRGERGIKGEMGSPTGRDQIQAIIEDGMQNA